MSGQFQSFQPRNPNEPSQKAVRGYIAADTQLQPCYSARCENKTTALDKLSLLCLCTTFPLHKQYQTPFTQHTKRFFLSCIKIETGLTLYQHMVCAFGNCSNAYIPSSGMKISTVEAPAVAQWHQGFSKTGEDGSIKQKLIIPVIHLKFKY